MKERTTTKRDVFVVSFCFLLLWTALGSSMFGGTTTSDYLNIYTGASLALEGRFGGLHSPEAQLARERELVPQTRELRPFVRPPWYALVLAPLALFSYSTGLWIWTCVQVAVLALCISWASRRFGFEATLIGAMFSLAWLGIAAGQDAPFLLAVLIGSYVLAEAKRPVWSGTVLGLGLFKFHLLLLWPLLLLFGKRFRMLIGFAVAGIVEILVCLALSGTAGLKAYLDLLMRQDITHLTPAPERNVNLQGLLLNLGLGNKAVWIAICILVTVLACVTVARAPLWKLFAVSTSASLMIAPHIYAYDITLLLAPIWFAVSARESRWTRATALALLIPYVLLNGLVGTWWAALSVVSMISFWVMLCSSEFRTDGSQLDVAELPLSTVPYGTATRV